MEDDAMSVASFIARRLMAAGVNRMYGYPGSSNIELMEGARVEGLETVLATREGTAAFMAEAEGLLTGRPGVCLSTLGPGSTALVNGVAAANLDRAPLIALSGQIGSAREPYFTHQVVNHEQLFGPVVKWVTRMNAESAPTIMHKALRTAVAERPGAVHITVNSDVATASVGGTADTNLLSVDSEHAVGLSVASVADAGDVHERVLRARRPIILAGPSVVRSGAEADLLALAETHHIPVVTSPMAKGTIPEDHRLFAGVVDMACKDVIWSFLEQADLMLCIGFDPVELVNSWSLATDVVHVDRIPNTDQVYFARHEVVGPISLACQWLSQGASGSAWTDSEIERHRSQLADAYYEGRVAGRLNPTDVMDVLVEQAEGAIATTDVGSHKMLFGQGWRTTAPRTALMSNGLSSMGFSLPAAMAAKLLHPDRTVIATMGDGGLAMTQPELRTAASLGLAVVVVVILDNSLNRIELKQMLKGYPSVATRIDTTDCAKLAESMGCNGTTVETAADLSRAVADAVQDGGTTVIGARVDPSQYETQF